MKVFFTFLLLVNFKVCIFSLDWKSLSLELETTSSKKKLNAAFTYKNSNSKSIVFKKIKASCGCILVNKPKIVEPGKSGEIKFSAPVPFRGGSYTKTIIVETDEENHNNYTLKFKITNTDPYVKRILKNTENNSSTMKPYIPAKGYNRPQKMTERAILVEKLLAQQTLARKKSYHVQEECPFLPLPIDKKLFHDYNGMRIYTCCEQCLVLVKESPHHAIIKLGEKTQTPVLVKDIE